MKKIEYLKCATPWSDHDWKLKIVIVESLDDITQLYFHVSLSITNRVMLIKSCTFNTVAGWTDVVVSNLFTTIHWWLNFIRKHLLESFPSVTGNNIPFPLTSNIKRWSSIPAHIDQWSPSWVLQALCQMLYHPQDVLYDPHAISHIKAI